MRICAGAWDCEKRPGGLDGYHFPGGASLSSTGEPLCHMHICMSAQQETYEHVTILDMGKLAGEQVRYADILRSCLKSHARSCLWRSGKELQSSRSFQHLG